jgi:hypothetical protein
MYDLLLLHRRVNFDHTKRCNDYRAVENVYSENDRVLFRKTYNSLQAAGPDSLRRSISPLRFHNHCFVRHESVEQVVDNVRCKYSVIDMQIVTDLGTVLSQAHPLAALHPCRL